MMRRAVLIPLLGFVSAGLFAAGCQQLSSVESSGVQSGDLNGVLDQYAPTGPGGINLFPTWQDFERMNADRPINDPPWKGALLGQVSFSRDRDFRQNAQERAEFSINPEGRIGADDFLSILRPGPVAYDAFERTLKMVNFQGDIREEYSKYLNNLVTQGMALLTLNRIIDNESMKKKLPKEVSDERLEYISKAVVIRNAVALGKIDFREEPVTHPDGRPFQDANGRPVMRRVIGGHPSASEDQMYDWFVEAVNGRSFCLNIDWKYDDGGLADELQRITRGQGELPYPELTLEFRCGAPAPAQCSNRKQTVLVTQGCLPKVEQADLAAMIDEQAWYEGLIEPTSAAHREQIRQAVAQALEQSKPSDLAEILARQNQQEIRAVVVRALDRLAANQQKTFSPASKARVAQNAAIHVVKQDTRRFKTVMKDMLKPLHRSLRRQAAWSIIVRQAVPDAQNLVQYSVTNQEVDRIYSADRQRYTVSEEIKSQREAGRTPDPELVKRLRELGGEPVFTRQQLTATFHEFTASGAKSQDFERRFVVLMTEKQRELVTELNAGGAPQTEEERARRRARVLEARRTVPVQVFQQVQAEFAADIAAGSVRLERLDRSINHVVGLAAPAANEGTDAVESRFRRNFFDSAFAQLPYAIAVVTDARGARHIGVLKEVDAGQRQMLAKDNAIVSDTIRNSILGKANVWVMREAAFKLFRSNRLRKQVDTCMDPKWPCMGDLNAERMALALFPERLYDGERLRQEHFVTYGDGSTVPTGPEAPHTLGRRTELPKVQEISTQVFRRVFDVPNQGS